MLQHHKGNGSWVRELRSHVLAVQNGATCSPTPYFCGAALPYRKPEGGVDCGITASCSPTPYFCGAELPYRKPEGGVVCVGVGFSPTPYFSGAALPNRKPDGGL